MFVTQAEAQGLSTHQMGGFDRAAAAELFGIDPRFTPVVVVAVGVRQEEHGLPEDLAARESAARDRLPLSDLVLTPAAPALRRTA
ncbi:MAG TPA: nitroreductase family protein [Mycobacteriales bacterium]|nr:nitroreductase family protein [Mycobacteriales bacterium]